MATDRLPHVFDKHGICKHCPTQTGQSDATAECPVRLRAEVERLRALLREWLECVEDEAHATGCGRVVRDTRAALEVNDG